LVAMLFAGLTHARVRRGLHRSMLVSTFPERFDIRGEIWRVNIQRFASG
jgi:hypothetical protein